MTTIYLPYLRRSFNFADARDIHDTAVLGQVIKNSVLNHFHTKFSQPFVVINKYQVHITEPEFGPDPDTSDDALFDALANNKSVAIPLRARVKIVDLENNQVIFNRKKLIAHIPYPFPQGFFVLNGTKYTLTSQLRLKPGIYFRFGSGGSVPEAMVNYAGVPELSHKYIFDPRTRRFIVKVGQSQISGYTWLKWLGFNEDQIRYALGDELYEINKNYTSGPASWTKLIEKWKTFAPTGYDKLPQDQVLEHIIKSADLDHEVTKAIYGTPIKKLDKNVVLDTFMKLRNMYARRWRPIDKDDLGFKQLYGPEDLLAESFNLLPQTIAYNLRKLGFTPGKTVSDVLPSGFMTEYVMNFFYNSGLGQNPDEVNPFELYDLSTRISIMGRGGIESEEAVPAEARNIHASYLGFIDPIRSPEKNVGVDMRPTSGVIKVGREMYGLFYNYRTGRYEWVRPIDLLDKTVGFPESLNWPSNMVPAIKNRQLGLANKKDLDYVLPSFYRMHHPSVALLPLFNASFAHRLAMGSKALTQAVPLVHREAPLVQNAINEREGWYDYMGKRYGKVLLSDVKGIVEKVTDKSIIIRTGRNETKEYKLANYLPSNRATYYYQYPAVKEGDKVKEGDLLAYSNFTDKNGTLAVGVNLRTAYLPYRGFTTEDAFVISESAAKKLTSQHLLNFEHYDASSIIRDKNRFISIFPTKYTAEQLKKLDDTGVVKPGQVLQRGDPIVLLMSNPEESIFWIHGKKFKLKPSDVSMTWDEDASGEVLKVIKDDKGGVKVFIKTERPAQVGDKLTGLYGDKGVISAIIPDEQMPVDEEGRRIEIIENPLSLFRRNPSLLLAGWLGLVAEKTGKRYLVNIEPDKIPDLYNYIMNETKKHGVKLTATLTDPVTGQKLPNISLGNRYFLKLKFISEHALSGRSFGGYTIEDTPTKGGEYGCLPATEKVLTASGIKTVKYLHSADNYVEDALVAVNDSEIVLRRPSSKFSYLIPNKNFFVEIKTAQGRKVVVSKNHKMLLADRTIKLAEKIKKGDQLLVATIEPNFYQRSTILVLYLLFDLVMKKDCIFVKFNIQNYHLKQLLYSVLKPFVAPDEMRVDEKVYSVKLHFNPSWYFNSYFRSIITNIDDEITNAVSSSYFFASLLVAFCGKLTKSGCLSLEFKNCEKRILTILENAFNNRQYYCRLAQQCLVDKLIFDKQSTDSLLANCVRYLSQNLINDSGLGFSLYQLKNNIYGIFISKPVTVSSSFSVSDQDNLSDKEKNKITIHADEVVSVEVLPQDHPIYKSEYMYDFSIDPESNYITADWIVVSNSKRVGLLNTYGLLAHGAVNILRDIKLIRGQRNDVFWHNYIYGLPLPTLESPLVYKKFLAYLTGMGIKINDKRDYLSLSPLTDTDIDVLAHRRYIESEKALKITSQGKAEPLPGGLFDEKLTGGVDGTLWTAIKLPVPLPNPMVAPFIRKLFGWTETEFLDILSGRAGVDSNGNYVKPEKANLVSRYYSGPNGLKAFLENVSAKKLYDHQKELYFSASNPQEKSRYIENLIFLRTLIDNDIVLKDLLWTKVPVVPPIFRPVAPAMLSGQKKETLIIADANHLYIDLIRAIKNYENLRGELSDLSEEILTMYKGLEAAVGLTNPLSKSANNRNIRGLLYHVFNGSPKYSMMQYQLLATPVDIVGMSVIIPNPYLKLDEVALPENSLWEVYRPFILRKLIMKGISPKTAMEMIENKHESAKNALLEEMKFRPVIIDRAPLLHKFGMLAFWPKITKSNVMELNPLVLTGFNADFDGDKMNFHVPITEEARLEAVEKLLPSRGVINPRTMEAQHIPVKDFAGGIFLAANTKEDRTKPRKVYYDKKQLMKDLMEGKITLDQPVTLVVQ
jgi:DNA-directed RNA polymerase beta subunit